MPETYQIKTQKFAGPIEKLLELIEKRELEINEIALSEVTQDFLKYIDSLQGKIETIFLSDFLSIAAQLVFMKSKRLLPGVELNEDEEKNIGELEARLLLYKEFKLGQNHIKKLWRDTPYSTGREFLKNVSEETFFFPPTKLTPSDLKTAIEKILEEISALVPKSQDIKRAVITIEAKVTEILERLSAWQKQGFKDLASQKTKEEVIALFLAILHLLRDKVIEVEQEEHFGDIMVRKS